MDTRKITIADLTGAAANALGKTPEEINTSETFEQAVYDMAKDNSLLNLPDHNMTGHAHYNVKDDKITVQYLMRESGHIHSFIHELAKFYNAYFPETKVSAFKGYSSEGDTISFLAIPFIDKVLPTMKLWKEKPSQVVLHKDVEAFKRGPEFHKHEHIIAHC